MVDDFDQFEAVFGFKSDVAYNQQTIDDIVRNRRTLENLLFIDRLLKALGIDKASKLYPPRSAFDLRNLHERIVASESPDHHKQSIFYYILKDLAHLSRHAAEGFARATYLPEKFKIFIDGIWYMDRLKFERALEHLTEPALIPTFPEDILYTLCRFAPENDCSLPLAYFHTVSPCIASNKVLEAFFLIVCRASVTEAFFFSREQGEFIHRNLFEKLINFVLVDSTGTIRAKRSVELINLPFDNVENNWFEEYLKDGKGRTLSGASDTIIMKGLATGDSTFLLEHGQSIAGRKIAGVNWATIRESLQHGPGIDAGSRDVLMS
ncbi:hypothetical protein MMC07_005136 [Pseudocyphellaria aurata]|nr:hypothetical protein [Pseudocyphellaria aurata]